MIRIALLVAGIFAIVESAAARTVEASVTKLENDYEIRVVIEERSWIPLDPQAGFFPMRHHEEWFLTTGDGESKTIDGRQYKKFAIGKDVLPIGDNCLYSDGEILFSTDADELIIKANLAPGYPHYNNHLDTYRNVKFSSLSIIELQKTSDLMELAGSVVKARGTFPESRQFLSEAGVTYEVSDSCTPKDNKPIEILARVFKPHSGAPYLYVLRKEGIKCCRGRHC
jgi:hypothetical protein